MRGLSTERAVRKEIIFEGIFSLEVKKEIPRREFFVFRLWNSIFEQELYGVRKLSSIALKDSVPIARFLWFFWSFQAWCKPFRKLVEWNAASRFSSRKGEAFQWPIRKGGDGKNHSSKGRRRSSNRLRVLHHYLYRWCGSSGRVQTLVYLRFFLGIRCKELFPGLGCALSRCVLCV